MAPLADPQSGKCSYIDHLSSIVSAKKTTIKKMTFTRCFALNPSFSFGAIWDLFLVEHMNGPNRAQQMNGPNK